MTITTSRSWSPSQGIAPSRSRELFTDLRRDAAQVEQREAEGRVHEGGLHVDAEQHAEPDEVDAERLGHRREQRDDDEGDLEEVEEEREEEDERC